MRNSILLFILFFLAFLLVCPPFYFLLPASVVFTVHFIQHLSLHLQSIYSLKADSFLFSLHLSSFYLLKLSEGDQRLRVVFSDVSKARFKQSCTVRGCSHGVINE